MTILSSSASRESITTVARWNKREFVGINDPELAHWYELGVYWAMYGDGQGSGRYDDCYLITNLTNHIRAGWYDNCNSGWFPMLGFELGMVHGGYLVEPAATLVVLTDPDFANGYRVGRDYYFTEHPAEPTDCYFIEHIHQWALEYPEWRDADAVLRYVLGCRIGELSAVLIPATKPAPVF